jgi:segregation and condensation protein B
MARPKPSFSHFGLEGLSDLPGLDELKALACSMAACRRASPSGAVGRSTLREDEDPLEPGDLDLGLAPPPERIEE